ncbi:MAG: hypothetical protein Q8L37_02595 [Candidatus Gottesmanbacteria bacterium]|nr:hypothetical protein [Candidatus Gottesmanbacteria bacterium]
MKAFIPFFTYFPEIADEETNVVQILKSEINTPPMGAYAIVENFCDDKKCDCRKVMFNVIAIDQLGKILATVGYGWESVSFYATWADGDRELAKQMVGTYLEPLCTQSKYSEYFCSFIADMVKEESFRSRVICHYQLFRKFKPHKQN